MLRFMVIFPLTVLRPDWAFQPSTGRRAGRMQGAPFFFARGAFRAPPGAAAGYGWRELGAARATGAGSWPGPD